MANALASAAHHLVPPPLRSSTHDDKEGRDSRDDSRQSHHSVQEKDKASQPDYDFESHPSHHPPADNQRYSQQQSRGSAPPPQEHSHLRPWKKTESEKEREEEKHRIAQMADDFRSIGAMEVEDIMKDPKQKIVGHSSQTLRCKDFDLVKTLGTGTCLTVWRTLATTASCGRH